MEQDINELEISLDAAGRARVDAEKIGKKCQVEIKVYFRYILKMQYCI